MRAGVQQFLPKRKPNIASFQSLSSRCLDVLVSNFNELFSVEQEDNKKHTNKERIPASNFVDILEALPSDKLDTHVGAEVVHNEDFWKRAALQTFGCSKCVIESHGLSWKRLYFEKYLSHLLNKNEVGGCEHLIKMVSKKR